MFDEDRSGELSQGALLLTFSLTFLALLLVCLSFFSQRLGSSGEIIKLLLRLSVVGNQEDAIKVMRAMDENNDGSIDLREFLDGMDDIAVEGKFIHVSSQQNLSLLVIRRHAL